jgi:amidase
VSDAFALLDATAQADLVRRGDVQPVELVEAAIARIEQLNPTLNAVITPLFDKARAQATARDLRAGPFRGVPLLLKDFLCHTAGDPYYEGMRLLQGLGWRATHDTYLAAKFQAAGFVIVGKTNLPELASGATTEPVAFGPTRNPWDLARSPGGSSGGSAAAVAAGLVPVAHGNDVTGSLRIPASACGLVGLKPSRGRTSAGPARLPGLLGNVVEHVLTRTVRDTAAILDVVAGPIRGDLFVAPRPGRPYRDEIGADPGRLRIGLLISDPFLELPIAPACLAAIRDTGHLLASLGHVVDEAFPSALTGPTGLGLAWHIISVSGLAARVDGWSERIGRAITADDVEPGTWASVQEGHSFSAVQVHAAVQRLAAEVMRVPEWWADFDVLVTPTMQQPPPSHLVRGWGTHSGHNFDGWNGAVRPRHAGCPRVAPGHWALS